MITAATSKVGEAIQALLKGDGPGPTPLIVSAAAGVLCCLLLVLLTTAHQKRRGTANTSNKPTKPLPILPGYPVIGNTVEMLNNLPRFLEWLMECTRKPELGGPDGLGSWGFNVALQPPFVVVHDPECVRHVLTQVDRYGKGPVWRTNFWPILGDGIFSADGQNWLVQRKRAANMFKVANFKHSMLEAVRGKLQRFLHILDEKVVAEGVGVNDGAVGPSAKREEKGEDEDDVADGTSKGKGKGQQPSAARASAVVEMQDLFFKLTLDTIGEIAFGRDLGSLSGKNLEFMRAFDYCQQYSNDLFFKPGPAWLWALLTPDGWANTQHARVLSGYGKQLVKEMIEEALAQEAKEENAEDVAAAALGDGEGGVVGEGEGKRKKETILSFFLAKETKETLRDAQTVRYLTDIIMNFQIAGRDTVAQAFSWAVHLLALHPEAQSKLRAEARAVLGPLSQAQSAATSYERIQRLEFGAAVVTEVLRLYPSVPKEGKWAYQDDVLPDGTRWIIFAPYVMGRLEALWSEPEAFKPERHLNKPKPSPFIFTAFQGGPRICLGQNLAYMQLQYGLALLLLAFDLEAVDGGKGVEMVQKSPTLPMRDGVRVRLTRRGEGEE